MRHAKFAGLALLILTAIADLAGQGIKVYPGATKFTPPANEETKRIAEALPPGTQQSFYLTNDSFEKVVAFYRGVAQEYAVPYARKSPKLPGGQELKEAYFIFDGGKNISVSKSWLKVQRPYIGSVTLKQGSVPEYHDIRDVTAIVAVEKK